MKKTAVAILVSAVFAAAAAAAGPTADQIMEVARQKAAEFALQGDFEQANRVIEQAKQFIQHLELAEPEEAPAQASTEAASPAAAAPEAPAEAPAADAPRAGEVRVLTLPGGADMAMVWCPPGSFTMGSPASEEGRDRDEMQHVVTLTEGFWLAKTEVTQAQWKSVMGDNPSRWIGDDLPVENVTWNDCVEFCRRAGNGLQLPTEAQWEYACRAESTGPYAGLMRIDPLAWCDGNSGRRTHEVGQKRTNAWGLQDMMGNVWEWCADWYGAYPGGEAIDPTGPESGFYRVRRGGGWGSRAQFCRSAARYEYDPLCAYSSIGFRVCCPALPAR